MPGLEERGRRARQHQCRALTVLLSDSARVDVDGVGQANYVRIGAAVKSLRRSDLMPRGDEMQEMQLLDVERRLERIERLLRAAADEARCCAPISGIRMGRVNAGR